MRIRVIDNFSRTAKPKRRLPYSPLGQLYSELNQLYRLHLARRSLGDGEVRMKTRRERRVVLEGALRDMHRSGMKLRCLKNFRGKHVRHILSQWQAQQLQSSTFATYASHLRSFCGWLVDEFNEMHPDLVRRRKVSEQDRSASLQVNVVDVLSRAFALDERFAAQLALAVAFGLRSMEAWLFRPHLALNSERRIQILWGTPGGRPRLLSSEVTSAHLAVLDWARSFAQTPLESMIPQGWTLQRWRRRYYHLRERLGLTRHQLGLIPDAIRNEMLIELYGWLKGIQAGAGDGCPPQKFDLGL